MKKYCIFRVYDYKGGELSSSLNLTREGLARELSELFESHIDLDSLSERRDRKISKVFDEETSSTPEIKEQIVKALNGKYFFSNYAGGDGFCGKIYEVENNNLTSVTIHQFVDDIANYIDKNWR